MSRVTQSVRLSWDLRGSSQDLDSGVELVCEFKCGLLTTDVQFHTLIVLACGFFKQLHLRFSVAKEIIRSSSWG